jgi:hypothetical protein
VSFPWQDIFKQKKTESYSIFYEQACVLFNVAAVYSSLGASQNVLLDDGLKLAASYFQVRSTVERLAL